MDDSDLLYRLRRGDSDALDALLARHWDAVVMFGIRTLSCADAAEDLAQEAFISLWERRAELDESRADLLTLLLHMVRNRSRNVHRSEDVRRRYSAVTREATGPSRVKTPAQILGEGELQAALDSAIRALPPRRREVLVLSRFHGLSYGQIGEVMEISPQTVANQLSRALADLRERLKPWLEPPQARELGLVRIGAPDLG
jgi:RNA polymerase sigma-70 factor, ECF subfamily